MKRAIMTSADRDFMNSPLVSDCAGCGKHPGILDKYGEYFCVDCVRNMALHTAAHTHLEDLLTAVVTSWATMWAVEFTGPELLEIVEMSGIEAQGVLAERLSKVGRDGPPEDVQPVHSAAG